ncbi:relaxase/mobilization nuclease domain-containing protein (plasmid) [Enterococcus cecorum]
MSTIQVSSTRNVIAALKYARDGKDKEQDKCVAQSGYGTNPKQSEWEFLAVRNAYHKNNGIQGHIIIQSFPTGEVSPKQANQLGLQLVTKINEQLPQEYQAAIYTHGNTDQIHNHIIINAVSAENGRKYTKYKQWEFVKDLNDELMRAHGLSIPERVAERETLVEQKLTEKEKYSWKSDLKQRINQAMDEVMSKVEPTIDAFKQQLKQLGVLVHDRKRKGVPIFMYQFTDEEEKDRKCKDFKLGGANYEKAEIESDIQRQQIQNIELQRQARRKHEQEATNAADIDTFIEMAANTSNAKKKCN